MVFHENHLLADDSHEISYLIFYKLRKTLQNLSSAAVVIDALRVNNYHAEPRYVFFFLKKSSVDPDQLASTEAS